MQLNDPERPLIGDRPAYGEPPLAVLPDLSVWPMSHDMCRLSVMLAVGRNEFAWFTCMANTSQLPLWLDEYRKNPEKFLMEKFAWAPPARNITAKALREQEVDNFLAGLNL